MLLCVVGCVSGFLVVFRLKVTLNNNTTLQWLPCDRLRKYHDNENQISEASHQLSDDNAGHNCEISSESSSSDEEETNGVPQGYDLRPRPTRQVERLMVSQTKLL